MEMASAAGVGLGEVVNVSENSVIPFPQPVYAMASGGGASAPMAPSPEIQPGTQDITDNVTITYALQ
jgi:uncharacterized protein YggE